VNIEGALFLMLGVIIALPILYLPLWLVDWLVGGRLIPLWLPFVIVAGAFVAGSLYLDTAGTIITARLVDESETINLKRNGSWNRSLSLQVEYHLPEELTTTSFTLGCDAATFDAMRIGQTVEARLLNFGEHFTLQK
jgi:hypothetical protein